MLKLDQIKNELAFGKLGSPSVTVESEALWEEGIGAVIKDSRFTFILDWLNEYNDISFLDMLDSHEDWHEIENIFHKYIAKSYAKQGIYEGKNIIRVGNKKITVELERSLDEIFGIELFSENHQIDCSYYTVGDNTYAMAQLFNSVLDNDQLLIDYLLYSDNLIAEIKTQLRKIVIYLKNEIEAYGYDRYTLNELGMQELMNGCNNLLNEYKA